ncbi:MAG TPA: UbiA family prenyltransferase [Gemmatimonadaceae bacterium]|nr:UbiA family prenyltransferase [Gemmatimonadaceae bacterium]
MRSARAIFALVRWRNALLAAAGVLLGAWWANGAPLTTSPLLAALAAIALAAFANAFNDVCDLEIDRVAHPARPLPRGDLRPRTALAIARSAALAGVVAAALARPALGVLSIAVVALMHSYSRTLAARGAVGNLVVAVLASLPFLYGAWSVGAPEAALPLLALAVPLHFAREVAKDLEDAHADAPLRRTLPVLLGRRGARGVFVIALLVFVAVLARFAVARPLFALLVLPALALCAAATWCVVAERRGSAVLLKSAMLWAMAALVVGGA